MSSIQVLLVEDAPAHVELIRRSFEDRTQPQVRLHVAETLDAAMQWLSQHTPDLILLDYLLPDGNATHFLSALPPQRTFPVVIMTSHGNEQVAVNVMKAGAFDYIVKSEYTFGEMPHLVRRMIREWNLTQEHQKAQDELKSFFNLSRDILGIADQAGLLRQVNPSFEELLGFTQLQLEEHSLLDFVPEKDHARTQVFLQEAYALQTAHSFETQMLTREGTMKWVEWVVQPYFEHDLLYMSGRDITERKQTEKQLIRAKEEAEQMSKLKSAFMANMSHEIRTPLTSILGFTNILAEEVTAEHRELVDTIERSGRRLMRTLNSVLDLSLLESGSLTAHPERLEVVREVQDAVDALLPVASRKGLALSLEASAPEIYCTVDRACLTRILDNLIDNGLKFTEEGGVSVVVRTEGSKVFVDVVDTGIGISQTFLDQLFDDFKQESSGIARSFEGTGLGLSITKRLVSLIGAELEVSTRKGAGSRFSVILSRDETRRSQGRRRDGLAGVERPPADRPPPRVLAVEDQADTRTLLDHFLNEYCEITCVPTAEAVLDIAEAGAFDIMLIDINLGHGMNGSELAERLRQRLGPETPPLIALTAFALPGDEQRFLAAGFDGYLSKPFKPEQLLSTVLTHAAHGHANNASVDKGREWL